MRIVVALGGNALSKRGEPLTAEGQRESIRIAAGSLAALLEAGHEVVITHGNGPQVGYLALQGGVFPLDVLGAETDGMIGYVLQQELDNAYMPDAQYATLLTQIEVDPDDPAFQAPTKFIGPIYSHEDAEKLGKERGWTIGQDGAHFRRTVPSPRPKRILELGVIELLLAQKVIVICAGGGGIPVVQKADGSMIGVEAVIDKDHASGLLARELNADAFLMLTDVEGVFEGWGTPEQAIIPYATPHMLEMMSFPAGSMGPKVEAACDFALGTGGFAAIGRLSDCMQLVDGTTGTRIGLKP
ncbi:Carbamate kinase [Sulfitobacter noctilucicola]|uniref:Carbamate kinase n=1 Tax=Sulfitobacter noctilucicola TaxID=1342301 RepID=A0A7W6Q4D2_9RHOB|nr:carbamate kinase [Sulfitobacter noctilucicola]KIN62675.1 Carbamate kinase [Sulfitobacter noctilucicola]MBB4172792.1 carbamate kinase [Sulfitobacter noctilucicola]